MLNLFNKIIASDGTANDTFGISVAISGEYSIVGSYLDDVGADIDEGSAYIYIRSDKSWIQHTKLNANDGDDGNGFGYSVAIKGDYAIVGAPQANNAQGAAYIFKRSGTSWTQQTKLIANDGESGDQFGISVSIASDYVVVGAYQAKVGNDKQRGTAYVFTLSSNTWSQSSKLTATDGSKDDNFGISVASSGDYIAVGAHRVDNKGAVYVFKRSGSSWSQQAKLSATDGASNNQFGISVSIDNSYIIAGANQAKISNKSNQGAAYIFAQQGDGSWSQQTKLTANDGIANDQFGFSVNINDGFAVVGAYQAKVGTNTQQGSVYVFALSGSTWTQNTKIVATDGAANDRYGVSVAASHAYIVVGAYQDKVGYNTGQGSAYVYYNGDQLSKDVTISAGANKTIVKGQSTTLGSGTPLSNVVYSWTPTTGITGSTTSLTTTAQPSNTTIYTLKATSTLDNSFTGYSSVTITVSDITPIIASSSPTTVLANHSFKVSFQVNAINAYTDDIYYTITGPGCNISKVAGKLNKPLLSPSITAPDASTDLVYTLTASLGNLSDSVTSTTTIHVQKVVATAGINQNIAKGQSVTLGTGSPQPNVTYAWKPTASITGSATALITTAAPLTTTTYTLTATSTIDTSYSDVASVTVNIAQSALAITNVVAPTLALANHPFSISFQVTDPNAYSNAIKYSISGYGINVSNANSTLGATIVSPTITAPDATTDVTYTITASLAGFADTATATVSVHTQKITATPGTTKTILKGQTVTLGTGAPQNDVNYKWDSTADITGDPNTLITTARPLETKTYTLTATSAFDDDYAEADTVTINVSPLILMISDISAPMLLP